MAKDPAVVVGREVVGELCPVVGDAGVFAAVFVLPLQSVHGACLGCSVTVGGVAVRPADGGCRRLSGLTGGGRCLAQQGRRCGCLCLDRAVSCDRTA